MKTDGRRYRAKVSGVGRNDNLLTHIEVGQV